MCPQDKGGGGREGREELRRWAKTEKKGEGYLNKKEKGGGEGHGIKAFARLATISSI